MAALGELPMVDVAIHSDTTHERSATYEFAAQWTSWLVERGVNVATVINGGREGTDVVIGGGEIPIPAHTRNDGKDGTIRRQCTGAWKIRPIRRYLQAHRQGAPVELWLGITTDEFQRAKDSEVGYITHRFPLLELGMSRADCLTWLAAHDLPSPGKSSCVFCPYLNRKAWQQMKRAGGADWQHAVEVDAAIRDVRLPGQLFVHPKRLPLEQAVVIPEDSGYTQLDMLSSDDADAECDTGFCFL
jgi:hypothetical protein